MFHGVLLAHSERGRGRHWRRAGWSSSRRLPAPEQAFLRGAGSAQCVCHLNSFETALMLYMLYTDCAACPHSPGGRASLTALAERGYLDFGASYAGGTPQAMMQHYLNQFRSTNFSPESDLTLLDPGPTPTLATYRDPSQKWLFQIPPKMQAAGVPVPGAKPKVLQLPSM